MTLHTQATTQGLSVPHLMCRRTKGTSTTVRLYCGFFRDSGAQYKTADLFTYLSFAAKFYFILRMFAPGTWYQIFSLRYFAHPSPNFHCGQHKCEIWPKV